MTKEALCRQVGRRGPVLCHYPVTDRRFGAVLSRSPLGVLFSFGAFGHAFGIGWTVR